MNRLQIIETPDYILAVSEEKIKEGDYVLYHKYKISQVLGINIDELKLERGGIWRSSCKKIIAYQPKNNAPELDLPLLPEIVVEDDIEKLAERLVDKETNASLQSPNRKHYEKYVKIGLKAATKVYSEDDITIIRNKLVNILPVGDVSAWDMIQAISNYTKWFDNYIESLKQAKTPKWFVAEIERLEPLKQTISKEFDEDDVVYELKITTINGKTYLVGTYLYE
jgi:hypothetical protein